jgi:hypothetical protein
VHFARVPQTVLLALIVGLLISAGGCSVGRTNRPNIQGAKEFTRFPLYWVGERFEKWNLTHIEGLDRPDDFVAFSYGTCTPSGGGDEQSCTLPLEIQVSRLCAHLDAVASSPIWRHRRIRGAPVGTIDSAPVLFTRGAQVKVYGGEGSDSGLPLRALHALRSINRIPPVIGPTGAIPPPSRAILGGTQPCPS